VGFLGSVNLLAVGNAQVFVKLRRGWRGEILIIFGRFGDGFGVLGRALGI
jgi:hypothetical protein